MALRKTFDHLALTLRQLANAVRELEVHIADESAADAVLVERLEEAVQDLLASLGEARVAVGRALAPGERAAGLELGVSELARCHECVLDATRKLGALLTHESIRDLLELGRRRGGSWLPWAQEVRDALERCRGPLDDVHQRLLECWLDLAEWSAAGSVSVRATNIGQQVTVPSKPADEAGPMKTRGSDRPAPAGAWSD
jgi:hypothetical protein